MRTLAIGDIHGCSRALDALLTAVAPLRGDLFITLGDYVDWGPDSRGVIDRLIALDSTCRLVPLRGNHEELMLRARQFPIELDSWLNVGGRTALAPYGDAGIPDSYWEFLETRCIDHFETESHIFVHGGLDADLPVAAQKVHILRWKTFRDPKPHCSGKTMVCGHSTQRNGWPSDLGFAVCIDTAASQGGWLTCLDIRSGKFWQANQHGQLRSANLGELRGKLMES